MLNFVYPDTVDQTPVPLALSEPDLARLKEVVKGLSALHGRLTTLPEHLLDDDDKEEVTKLLKIGDTYARTVLEFIEPVAVFQAAIHENAAFSQDLIGVMERFVSYVNENLDENLATANAESSGNVGKA